MVLCHHGNYLLVDCIPFLDVHLEARGISMNQTRTVILTHLHDDHCSMFPLLLSAHRIKLVTTREIYEMAMIKLARGLGREPERIADSFELVELIPSQTLRHYGLEIEPHVTVHSIPTIGVTVSSNHLGRTHRICIVGDNQGFEEIRIMREAGVLRESTEARLHDLYRQPYDLLVADGGMGAIHGDPADAIDSRAEQVVFVHVDKLPARFTATFSLASAGKRYTVVDGESDLYTARVLDFFAANFDLGVPSRWLSALLGDKRIVRYNRDDVILKQGSDSRGSIFVVLTGEADVIVHDGSVGTRQAGDFIGEMAAETGVKSRNASVVARSPVTLCEFSKETFFKFVSGEALVDSLISRWSLRERLAGLAVFQGPTTTVIERIARLTQVVELDSGEVLDVDPGYWYLVLDGGADGCGVEGGALPCGTDGWQSMKADSACDVARIKSPAAEDLMKMSPQFNYRLRCYRLHGAARK